MGLLTPSGIYADKTAARFFRSLSTTGRVGGLFEFENRRLGTELPPFFPDVDSRFKFCALIFGGDERRFDQTTCAFFLHDTRAVGDPQRCLPLTPDDFARVNPNTGTAPVFRTRRDADVTRRIYANHPILVDRSGGEERRDLGHDGPPFTWDQDERRHLRARLDALYFRLYGLSREHAAYVLDTFPIVRRHDEAAFGSYRTRTLVLAYITPSPPATRNGRGVVVSTIATVLDGTADTLSDRRGGPSRLPSWKSQP